jgi:hypothetical protein
MVLKMAKECTNTKMEIVLQGFGKMIRNGKVGIHFMMDAYSKVNLDKMQYSKEVCYIQMVMFMRDSLNMVKEMDLEDIF